MHRRAVWGCCACFMGRYGVAVLPLRYRVPEYTANAAIGMPRRGAWAMVWQVLWTAALVQSPGVPSKGGRMMTFMTPPRPPPPPMSPQYTLPLPLGRADQKCPFHLLFGCLRPLPGPMRPVGLEMARHKSPSPPHGGGGVVLEFRY